MPEGRPEFPLFSVDETAALLHVRPSTVESRIRSGELHTRVGVGGRDRQVVLEPDRDWLRAEDAGAILGISSGTVRARITRGELVGRRDTKKRWRVLLESVLAAPGCPDEVAAMFGREAPERPAAASPPISRPPTLRRQLNVHLTEEEAETLEVARDRHGSYRAAVVAGLHLCLEGAPTPEDYAELRAERDLHEEAIEGARREIRELRESSAQAVDELFCPRCGAFVPPAEWRLVEVDDGHTIEISHSAHSHTKGGAFRESSVMARRQK